MARTVDEAFREFLSNKVNLDPGETKTARASRDWLRGQLRELPQKYSDFPRSYSDKDIDYGSFSRRTKIRPLDDIDLVSCMMGEGSTYLDFGGVLEITVPPGARLRDMCDDGTDKLNSRKVINRFVQGLSKIPAYRRAEVSRNGEAAVLALGSYEWSYDIVPAFFTSPEWDNRDYYVIPDGTGRWKKTDPRIDRDRVARINSQHSGWVLNPLRLAKFWNKRGRMPTIDGYLFECMVLAHYEAFFSTCTQFPDREFRSILGAIKSAVMNPVPDPKRIQGNLNSLSIDDRIAIANRAAQDAVVADAAIAAENAGEMNKAIYLWGTIFGTDFPSYG